MVTACSQDQCTLYKGSFLSNLLCRRCDTQVLEAWITRLLQMSWSTAATGQRCSHRVWHSHPNPSPSPVLSHYPHRCVGKWLARGLQTQVRLPNIRARENTRLPPTNHVRDISSGWCNDDFKMKRELVLLTLAHFNLRGKKEMSTSAKKALKQKLQGKCDTTWWVLCIHIAFCS